MDARLISIQLLLGALGIVGVAAAAPDLTLEQGVRLVVAVALTFLISRLKARHVVKASPYVFVSLLVLLVVVLVAGTSPAGSDSKRWLLIGNLSLQPSEFMKVAVVAYLAAFFYNHLGNWHIWRPMLVIGLTAGLILIEPDFSTAAFIFLLALSVMIAAGATVTRIISISLAAAIVTGLLAGPMISQYSYWGDRILGYTDMRGARQETAGISYQANVAENAIKRGGLVGIGPGRPVRVPEAETDFIAVAIHQALGFMGVLTLLLLYILLAFYGLKIARSVTGPSALLAAGATTYIVAQAGVNLLMASGMGLVMGMPLPGVSYGLNSMMSVAIAFGFLHMAARQARDSQVAPAGWGQA